jgi:hypothetical protein
MAKGVKHRDVNYEEADMEEVLNWLHTDHQATELSNYYFKRNDAGLKQFLLDNPVDGPTLYLLIEYAYAGIVSRITAYGGQVKHEKSDYPKLKSQVLALFKLEAHKRDDKTGKPLYKSKSAFINFALRKLPPMKDPNRPLTPRAISNWLEAERSSFPDHWPKSGK